MRRAGHVIVIGVDGMSPQWVINAKTPVMDDLMANGALHTQRSRSASHQQQSQLGFDGVRSWPGTTWCYFK